MTATTTKTPIMMYGLVRENIDEEDVDGVVVSDDCTPVGEVIVISSLTPFCDVVRSCTCAIV